MSMDCCKDGHDFFVAKRGYYKEDGGTIAMLGGAPSYDHSIEYSMLACKRCGETKEVVSGDHRKTSLGVL